MQDIGPYKTQILSFKGQYKQEKNKNITILLITGNPGSVRFYDKFLDKLYNLLDQEFDIYAIGQLNHFEYEGKNQFQKYDLSHNLIHKKLFVKYLLQQNPNRQFFFMGHSIGSYMQLNAMEVLKSEQILQTYMLYPTIYNMYNTPSGRSIRFLYPYFMHYVAGGVVYGLKTILPDYVLRFVISFFVDGKNNSDIVETVLDNLSFSNVLNALFLARDELDTLTELNQNLVQKYIEKCYYYFGTTDGWVPLEFAQYIIEKNPNIQYQYDQLGLKHAFVINGSEQQAEIIKDLIQKKLDGKNYS